ncbi:hypothetical protein CEXT_210051 [Caerostris extrusa]|uniref:Uncharacterized protein n=1 Tax=Caerostris extrusa TaxID=172846 RepID=A0AAV4R3H9_CAEEX|nr:hypothetical protein CEXT_210051 [Caerostris extrusa]
MSYTNPNVFKYEPQTVVYHILTPCPVYKPQTVGRPVLMCPSYEPQTVIYHVLTLFIFSVPDSRQLRRQERYVLILTCLVYDPHTVSCTNTNVFKYGPQTAVCHELRVKYTDHRQLNVLH